MTGIALTGAYDFHVPCPPVFVNENRFIRTLRDRARYDHNWPALGCGFGAQGPKSHCFTRSLVQIFRLSWNMRMNHNRASNDIRLKHHASARISLVPMGQALYPSLRHVAFTKEVSSKRFQHRH